MASNLGKDTKTGGNPSFRLYVLLNMNKILTAIQSLVTGFTPVTRTHNTINTVGNGTIAAGSLRGSVLNAGDADGIWNGINIPAGVSIPWGDIANRDPYGAITYDATGTNFVIEYTT